MQIIQGRYKFKYNLKNIFSDFIKISLLFTNNIKDDWWFFNLSRLDLRQAGGIDLNNNFDEKNNILEKIYILIFLNLKILYVTFLKIFLKKKKLKNKFLYLFVEQVKFNNININLTEYYFQNLFSKIPNKTVTIGFELKSKKSNEITLFELANTFDIFKSYFQTLITLFKYRKIKKKIRCLNLKEFKFWVNFLRIKEQDTNFKSVFLSKLLISILEKYPENKIKIIYPYEEKPFERALCILSKKYKNFYVFAYYGNLQDHHSFFLRKLSKLNIPRSSSFLCAGNYQKEQIIKFNSNKNIYIIGSDKSKIELKKNLQYDFLVFISHKIELNSFKKWVEQQHFKSKNIKFLVRLYSQLTENENNPDYLYLKNLKGFDFSDQSLKNDIAKSKFSIFSRTSAGPQAVNSELLSIWADFSLVGSNALNGKIEYFFPSFNSNQLNYNIEKFISLNENEIQNYLVKQKNISKKVFSEINYDLVDKILN